MKHLIWSLPILLVIWSCRSQAPLSSAPVAEPASQKAPTLLVKPTGDTISQPLRLQQLVAEVQVLAGAARVNLELTYANDLDEELSGTFFFPLASGQVVDSFALDLDGKLRPGVIVPRETGRQVFEEVVRSRIDPALLEWRRGQAFQARVFPIPAKGRKRIRLGYTIPMQYQDGNWTMTLPLRSDDPVDSISLRVSLPMDAEGQSQLIADAGSPDIRLSFADDPELGLWQGETFPLQHRWQIGYQPTQPLSQAPTVLMYEGEGGQTWFVARQSPPNLPPTKASKPSRVALLWDVSHSAGQRDMDRELAVLEAYLDRIGAVEVVLQPFHHQVLPQETFSLQAKQYAPLLDRLRVLPTDGATNLGAIDLQALAADVYLLSTDGWSTWAGPDFSPIGKPIHVLSSIVARNQLYLSGLASKTGGVMVMADQPQRSPAYWAEQMLRTGPRWQVVVEGQSSQPNPVSWSDISAPIMLTGELEADEDNLQIRYLRAGTTYATQTVALDKVAHLQGSDLPRRLWAQQRLEQLLTLSQPDPDSIIALGQRHGLVTPHTSLLVLDRLEDYLRFEIMPPPELQDAYQMEQRRRKKEKELKLMGHVDLVAEGLALRYDWWQTDYEIPDKPYQAAPGGNRQGVGMADTTTDEGSFGSFNDLSLEETVNAPADWADEDDPFDSDEADGYFDEAERMDMADGFEVADGEPAEATDAREMEEESDADSASERPEVAIELDSWQSGLPYEERLAASADDSLESTYFLLKPSYADLPAFYADAARICAARDQSQLALRILSNLAELDPDNPALLRVLGYRLLQADSLDLAAFVLQQVLRLRPDEPQAHRDLGLVLAKQGQTQAAIERLYEVVRQPWNDRFPEISILVAHELAALIGQSTQPLDLDFIDERLLKPMPTDLRVVLSWDANDVDLDLWVIDPRGEKCYYQHRQTEIGGWMSADFRGGYGPEEFLIKRAMPGRYVVKANYYADNEASLTGPATLQLRFIQDYGRPSQREKVTTLRLGAENEVVSVGSFTVEEP